MPAYVLTDQGSTDVFRRECDALGFPWFDDGDYDLNFFGIRGRSDDSNLFDDLIGCGLKVGGKPQVHLWRGTTDPGKPMLLRPMRPEGCAILCDGWHPKLWQIGTHHAGQPGAYEALTQFSEAPFWRDNDRDDHRDEDGPMTRGIIGCNQHHAGVDSTLVDSWSACCQVHKRTSTFTTALELAHKQRSIRGWATFGYKLFTVRKSPRLDAFLTAVS